MRTTTHSSASRKWPSLLFWPPPRRALENGVLILAIAHAPLMPLFWMPGGRLSFSFYLTHLLTFSLPFLLSFMVGLRIASIRRASTHQLWPGHFASLRRDMGLYLMLVIACSLLGANGDPTLSPTGGVSLALIIAVFTLYSMTKPILAVIAVSAPFLVSSVGDTPWSNPWIHWLVIAGTTIAIFGLLERRLPMQWWHRLSKSLRGSASTTVARKEKRRKSSPPASGQLSQISSTAEGRLVTTASSKGFWTAARLAHTELSGHHRYPILGLIWTWAIPFCLWLAFFDLTMFERFPAGSLRSPWLEHLANYLLTGGFLPKISSDTGFAQALALAYFTWQTLAFPRVQPHSETYAKGAIRAFFSMDRFRLWLRALLIGLPGIGIFITLQLGKGTEFISSRLGGQLGMTFYLAGILLCVVTGRRRQQTPLSHSLPYPLARPDKRRGAFIAALRWQASVAAISLLSMVLLAYIILEFLGSDSASVSHWYRWLPAAKPTALLLLFLPIAVALFFFDQDWTSFSAAFKTNRDAPATYQWTLVFCQALIWVGAWAAIVFALGIETPEPWTPLAAFILICSFGASQFLLWLQLKHRYGSSAWASTPLP